jgi:hypothetical protein
LAAFRLKFQGLYTIVDITPEILSRKSAQKNSKIDRTLVTQEVYYLRYCDDFIILHHDKEHLTSLICKIDEFLKSTLLLELHPNKIFIRKLTQGIDFIGYVLFSNHILLRSKTKKRMKKRLQKTYTSYLEHTVESVKMDQQLQSYLGLLSHANEHTLSTILKNAYWLRTQDFKKKPAIAGC